MSEKYTRNLLKMTVQYKKMQSILEYYESDEILFIS